MQPGVTPSRRGPAAAAWRRLPTLARAVLRYGVRHPSPRLLSLVLLEREVEAEVDAMTDRLFAGVEATLADRVRAGALSCPEGPEAVRFDYDTRLLLPAILAHGRLHLLAGDRPVGRRWRAVDDDLVAAAAETTESIVAALLDGDMRDAINDAEYDDFETNARPRAEAAAVAQALLRDRVETWFDEPDTPDAVEAHYAHAVELSEAHQDADRTFRDLLEAHRGADGADREAAAERIREAYRHAEPREPAALFEAERDLPYFATQYERVGVIYEDMLRMYEAALDVDLGRGFKRSIVLMVVAAQIGLDDTDDYPEDRGAQLTPVTAELNLRGPAEGLASLEAVVETYLDRAEAAAEDHLTGLAIEFIRQEATDRLDRLADEVVS